MNGKYYPELSLVSSCGWKASYDGKDLLCFPTTDIFSARLLWLSFQTLSWRFVPCFVGFLQQHVIFTVSFCAAHVFLSSSGYPASSLEAQTKLSLRKELLFSFNLKHCLSYKCWYFKWARSFWSVSLWSIQKSEVTLQLEKVLSLNVGQGSPLPSLPSARSLLSCLIQSKLAAGII